MRGNDSRGSWVGTTRLLLLALCAPFVTAQHDFTADNVTDILGTWSSGSGAVTTGPTFANPVNFTFNVPANPGVAFSFDDQGHFEEARYQFDSNGTEPHCIKAYLIFQRGNYTFQPNGSITTSPYQADGRIQVQDPCAYTTTIMTYYYQPGLYRNWTITNDANHQQYKLYMEEWDGTPLAPMWLKYSPPAMWPVGIQLTTNETIKEYAKANGSWNAGLASARPDYTLLATVALLLAGVAILR